MCIYFNICITYKKVSIIIRDSNVYLFWINLNIIKKYIILMKWIYYTKTTQNLLQGRISYVIEKISNFYMLFKLRKYV